MKDWLEVFGYLLLGIVAIAGFVLFIGVFIWMAITIVSIFVVLWAVGMRWKIYRDEELIGHVRWFTFYPRS